MRLPASGLRRRGAAAWEELAPGRVLPAAVRAELALAGGERVQAADMSPDGDWALVATDRALYYRPGRETQADGWSRLGWEEVAEVGWDAAAGQLIVIGVAGLAGAGPGAGPGAQAGTASGATPGAEAGTAPGAGPRARPARVLVPLRRRGSVPELALERVTHTRLGRWQLRAGGGRRAVIEARRRPGTGELVWSVTCDGHGAGLGDGPVDQALRARADRAIARLSAEFGALPQPGTGPSLFPPIDPRASLT
jgi:hypothetical protein